MRSIMQPVIADDFWNWLRFVSYWLHVVNYFRINLL